MTERVDPSAKTREVDGLQAPRWPDKETFDADVAEVMVCAVTGRPGVLQAPDEEYAERVFAAAERKMRRLFDA